MVGCMVSDEYRSMWTHGGGGHTGERAVELQNPIPKFKKNTQIFVNTNILTL